MDNNSKYFFALITAFLKETVPPKPINIDWEKIYYLSHIHFVSAAVYLSVQKIDKDEQPSQNILKRFKSDFFNTTLRYEEQEKAYEEITKKLNEEKIQHLFFKGTVLREYYPVKQMRTLGDIDFLLHEKDRNAVNEALLEIGYKNITNIGHWQYVKGKLLIEAHDKLMYSEINEKADYISYFQNAWNNANAEENSYTYKLNIEYHLIFVLTHIAKHFYGLGCGVRMILDIAVIINEFGDILDYTYLWKELKKLKLDVFAKNIFELCAGCFEVYVPGSEVEMDNETFEAISNYILEGGTFGFNNRNSTIHIIRKEYEKTDNHNLAQFKAFWGKIFLNYKTIINLYPILKKLPFLLPFAWIVRGFNCMVTRHKRTVNILKGLVSRSDEAEKSYEVMKKIGL